jgi:hypothetical protein
LPRIPLASSAPPAIGRGRIRFRTAHTGVEEASMAKSEAYPGPATALEAYQRIVAAVPSLERKGAKVPYTSVNGNMSSYLAEDGTLVLRLSAPDRLRFLDTHESRLHEAYGIVQKEYVDVPGDMLNDVEALRSWFEASHAYVAGLRPKATTRPTKG